MEADFLPALTATGVGNLPHQDKPRTIAFTADVLPRTFSWPKLLQDNVLENMVPRVSPGSFFLKLIKKRNFSPPLLKSSGELGKRRLMLLIFWLPFLLYGEGLIDFILKELAKQKGKNILLDGKVANTDGSTTKREIK